MYIYIFEIFHNFYKNSIEITFYYGNFQIYTYIFDIHMFYIHIYVKIKVRNAKQKTS